MRTGAVYRLSKNSSIYVGGGGAVATALTFALLGGVLRLVLAATVLALTLLTLIAVFFVRRHMFKSRLEELQSRFVQSGTVVPDGKYTKPRTWGVYRVESFRAGKRGYSYHLGNHPVREEELVREFGAVEIVGLFYSRTDAEEYKHLLATGQVG